MTDSTDGESTWTRLRRRKVVQWGIAYAAGAWGFLQEALAYVSSLLNWPAQLQKLTGLALLIGLPIALVVAWFHGDKGHRRVTRTELAILTGLFLLGGGIFWRYQHASQTVSVATPSSAIAPAAVIADDNSIAVLPFVNMSSDKEQDYFSDGLSEELLNLLAQVPQLRVIARTSSFSFKGKEADVATIARTLNVANVLEGSVRKSGDTLRITAQLIRTADSSHLWSQTYDRPMTDVFKVQDEIAAAVVDQLKIKLLGTAPKTKTTNPKAYALYLQAREVARHHSATAFNDAVALYQQSLFIDPDYAAAWVGLADTYCNEVNEIQRRPDEGFPLARAAIERALAADAGYAPAHALLGWIAAFFDRDLAAAARLVEHALTLDPLNPDILGVAAEVARRVGRLDTAISIGAYQVTQDPVNASGHFNLGLAYRYAGRSDEAISEFRTALKLSPEFIYAHTAIGEILLLEGDITAALTEMQQETDEFSRLYGLSLTNFALGHDAEADAMLAEFIRKYGNASASNVATIMAYRGENDRAFEWLEKAVHGHDPSLGAIIADRLLARLHDDPRWLPFLRKHGMAPEQLAAIKFDVKLPN